MILKIMPKHFKITNSIKSILLFTTAFAVLAFGSCKKDSNNQPALSISAKVDGTATAFNNNILGFKGTANSAAFTNIEGTDAAGNSVALTIYGDLVAGKTFSATTVFDGDAFLAYTTKSDDLYQLGGDASASTMFSVTITSVSGNKVSGTFQGTLKEFIVGPGTPHTKIITEGKFTAEITD